MAVLDADKAFERYTPALFAAPYSLFADHTGIENFPLK
jgi:hypothetical protein